MTEILIRILVIGVHYCVFIFADPHAYHTVDCIVQAVHAVAKRQIALEYTKENQDLVSGILQKVNIPVVLNTVEHRKETGIENRTSIDVFLLLKDTKPAEILNETLWNGDTRFIIITQHENIIEEYFEHFWKLKVINVFGMVLSTENITLYSFLPYGKKNCTKAELIIVDSCLKGKLQNQGSALQDAMRIKNMNQCPINVTISQAKPSLIFEPEEGQTTSSTAKGFEGKFIMAVAEVYNFNLTFKIAEDGIGWGWIHPSPRGAIGDVWLGVCEITVGVLAPFMERYEYLDLAVSYNMEECVTFTVPQGSGSKKAAWLTNFVMEFSYHTWILILISFIMIIINIWFINRYLRENWLKNELTLSLYSILLGVPIKSPHYVAARTALTFWVIFTFIVTVAYKASMGSMLAVPPREADIKNFKELLDSDLQLTGLKNHLQMLEHPEWPFIDLRKRYKIANEGVDHVIERVVNREKLALLYPKSYVLYFSLLNPKLRGRIHVLKDCIYAFRPHTMLKKFSPFTRKVSQTIRRLEESGIMEMWRSEHFKNISPSKKPVFKLTMDQMFGVFCFLIVGYVFALISFLCEVYIIFGIRKPFFCFQSDIISRR